MTSSTSSTLWMGDLEPYMNEEFITQAFYSSGEYILGVKLIREKHTGTPAGYCFVEFPDAEQAKLAMLKLNGKEVPGSQPSKRFKLNHASYGREHKTVPEYSLYVGDLSSEVDDLQLYQVFAKRYQSCRAATVLKDQRGESKGFGFVRFTDDTERRQALYEMQRYNGLGKKEIRVSLAMSRSRITPGSVPTTNVNQYRQFEGQNYYWQHYQNPYYNQTWGQSQGYDYYGNHQADPSQYHQTYHHHMEAHEDDNELEDPCLEVDVDKLNKEFMERSEELYMALEGSRWHPLDNVFSPVTPKVD